MAKKGPNLGQIPGYVRVPVTFVGRKVYLDSAGDNANSGLSFALPKRSLLDDPNGPGAMSLMRDGMSDQLLVTAGSTWVNEQIRWTKGGGADPMMIYAVGTGPRPRWEYTAGWQSYGWQIADTPKLTIKSIEIAGPGDPDWDVDACRGIEFSGAPDDLWLEDCKVHGFSYGIHAASGGSNLRLLKNMLYDCWHRCLYVKDITGPDIESNIFGPTTRDDALASTSAVCYIESGTVSPDFRGNLIYGAVAVGLDMRCDGFVRENLFVYNRHAMAFSEGELGLNLLGIDVTVNDNFVVEGQASGTGYGGAKGITLRNLRNGLVRGNIICNPVDTGDHYSLLQAQAITNGSAQPRFQNVQIESNIIGPGYAPASATTQPPIDFYGETGAAVDGNVIKRNLFYGHQQDYLFGVRSQTGMLQSAFTIAEDNRFYVANTPTEGDWLDDNGTAGGLTEWKAATPDSTSTYGDATFQSLAEATTAAYQTTITNATPGYAGFYADALARAKQVEPSDYDIKDTVLPWLRLKMVWNPVAPPQTGWTASPLAADAKEYYVSDSNGDDAWNGEAASHQGGNVGPKKTIGAGLDVMQDGGSVNGRPDHLYIERGDTYVYSDSPLFVSKSGRSEGSRLLIGAYGTGARPILRCAEVSWWGFDAIVLQNVSHVIIQDLEFRPQGDETVNSKAITCNSGGNDIIVEGCFFRYCFQAINFGTDNSTGPSNSQIRRNVFTLGGKHSVYSGQCAYILCEENIIHDVGSGTNQDQGFYFDNENGDHITLRGNIINDVYNAFNLRGQNGLAQNNLVTQCSVSLEIGGGDSWNHSSTVNGVNGDLLDNVVLDGATQWGAWLVNIKESLVANNLIAHMNGGDYGILVDSVSQGAKISNVVVDGNVLYDAGLWGVGVSGANFSAVTISNNDIADTSGTDDLTEYASGANSEFTSYQNRFYSTVVGEDWHYFDGAAKTLTEYKAEFENPPPAGTNVSASYVPAYPDAANATTAKYNLSLGGVESHAAFMAACLLQQKVDASGAPAWNTAYTAAAANTWFRAKFGL